MSSTGHQEPDTLSSSQEKSPDSYTNWMGMPVVLDITTGETKTSLLCTIIGESDSTVRVRIADQWDVDFDKQMILVADAFPYADGVHN